MRYLVMLTTQITKEVEAESFDEAVKEAQSCAARTFYYADDFNLVYIKKLEEDNG